MLLLTTSVLGLFAMLAQAEPAPPEPAEPAPAAPAPATPEPVTPLGAPAPPAPPPTAGPAEPAPVEPARPAAPSPAPAADAAEPPSSNCASVLIGVSVGLGGIPSDIGPQDGFSIGGSLEHTYTRPTTTLELGVAFDFFYDRASTAVIGLEPDPGTSGGEREVPGTRTISSTNFGLLQTLGIHDGRGRVWIGAGGGLSIGIFDSPEAGFQSGGGDAGHATSRLPFARAAIGSDLQIREQLALGLRASYSFMLKSSSFSSDNGQSFQPFGDLLDIHVGLFYRF